MPQISRKSIIKPSAKQPRRTSVTFQDIESENKSQYDEDSTYDDEEDSMTDMLGLLKEFQMRTAKTPAWSTAFRNKKASLYAEARKQADMIVCEGTKAIEQSKAKLSDLKAQQTLKDKPLNDLMLLWKNHEDSMRVLLDIYPELLEDLSPRRAAEINDANAMVDTHNSGRQNSRRRLIKSAKAHMDDNLEKQRLATDSTALIKHYKTLLRS